MLTFIILSLLLYSIIRFNLEDLNFGSAVIPLMAHGVTQTHVFPLCALKTPSERIFSPLSSIYAPCFVHFPAGLGYYT